MDITRSSSLRRTAMAALKPTPEGDQSMGADQAKASGPVHEAELLEAVGRLAGSVADDLNSALARARARLEVARAELQSMGSASANEAMDEVVRSLAHGTELVGSLLRLSRDRPTENARIDLRDLVRDAVRLLEHALPVDVRIRVDDPGTGIMITVAVPPSRPDGPGVSTEALARRRVLLVEDEPIVRKSLARQLKHMGFEVTAAGSGTEALTSLDAQPPDFVLSDLAMPGMDGVTLARRIREKYPLLPIVIMSGNVPEELQPQLLALDLRRLDKPFGDVELRAVLDLGAS
jgi:CheY-like chemotaxis protein